MLHLGLLHLIAELQSVAHPVYLPHLLAVDRSSKDEIIDLWSCIGVIQDVGALIAVLIEIYESDGTSNVFYFYHKLELFGSYLVYLDDVSLIGISFFPQGEKLLIRT